MPRLRRRQGNEIELSKTHGSSIGFSASGRPFAVDSRVDLDSPAVCPQSYFAHRKGTIRQTVYLRHRMYNEVRLRSLAPSSTRSSRVIATVELIRSSNWLSILKETISPGLGHVIGESKRMIGANNIIVVDELNSMLHRPLAQPARSDRTSFNLPSLLLLMGNGEPS